jgi:hypothetical protein
MEGNAELFGADWIFYADDFKCDRCELHLEGVDEIRMAGMQAHYILDDPFQFRTLASPACGLGVAEVGKWPFIEDGGEGDVEFEESFKESYGTLSEGVQGSGKTASDDGVRQRRLYVVPDPERTGS